MRISDWSSDVCSSDLEPAGGVCVGEQMSGGVDDHVLGTKGAEAVLERDAVSDHGRGVGPGAGGERQDRMVDVDHPVALFVDERRQLVHPAAVIEVVIGVLLHPFPAGGEKGVLNGIETFARDDDVEIADRASLARRKARGDIGGALRSEEHTSELQSLMRTSYAVFCLKKKK